MVSAGDAGPTVAHATQPVMSSPSLGLVGRRVVVEVPATSANLGAGYDCLGLALDITNEVEVEVLDDAELAGDGVGSHVELAVEGEGAGELRGDRSNRFVAGMEAAFGPAEFELPPRSRWRLAMRNRIPLSRGLGSSASATIGGLIAANALLGQPLDVPRLLRLATEIEGHPDNASAALLGGFVVSAVIDDEVEAIRFMTPLRISSSFSSSPTFACRRPTCARSFRNRCLSSMRWRISAAWPWVLRAWPPDEPTCSRR